MFMQVTSWPWCHDILGASTDISDFECYHTQPVVPKPFRITKEWYPPKLVSCQVKKCKIDLIFLGTYRI